MKKNSQRIEMSRLNEQEQEYLAIPIGYELQEIKQKLHVISVVSNPCNYKIRYKLAKEFMKRMEQEQNVLFYMVELVYGDQPFVLTSADNKMHLQLKGTTPLWHKENMINLGIKHLLPKDWKAVAWIDADIEFENAHWASDTLNILNNGKDFVQLFAQAVDMGVNDQTNVTFEGFGYQYINNSMKGHPGYAWACNRKTYEQIGGLLEHKIIGAADFVMANAFIKDVQMMEGTSEEFLRYGKEFEEKTDGLQIGYVSGNIKHYYHGKKINRNYVYREFLLVRYKFDPYTFLTTDPSGLLIPTDKFPREFLREIYQNFEMRNEDEGIENEK